MLTPSPLLSYDIPLCILYRLLVGTYLLLGTGSYNVSFSGASWCCETNSTVQCPANGLQCPGAQRCPAGQVCSAERIETADSQASAEFHTRPSSPLAEFATTTTILISTTIIICTFPPSYLVELLLGEPLVLPCELFAGQTTSQLLLQIVPRPGKIIVIIVLLRG